MKLPLTAIVVALCSISAHGAEAAAATDTIVSRKPHELNEIEILGVKQMPSAGVSSVTRIGRFDVRRLGIYSVKNVSEVAPNFYAPSYGSRMTSSIYVRGLGSRIDQAVVGLNVDGVPFLNKDLYDFDLPDIASMEVIRGAQNVLNGRNSMGGQINIYTLSPRDYQGFRAMAEWGRANTVRAAVGGYFALNDKLFTSLSAYYNHTDGFWRNEYNGSRVGRENGGTLRWKVVAEPSRALSITNTAALSLSRQSGYPYRSVESGRIAYNDTCFYRRNAFSDGLTVAWAGKRVVVTSLTSVQYLDDNMTLDQDFLPADYFTLTQKRREWTGTQDLFTKGTRGCYSWLGGVFGFGRHTSMSAPVTFYNTGIEKLIEGKRNEMNPDYPIEWDSRRFPLASEFSNTNCGFALYHESSVRLGRWKLGAGLRWDIESVTCHYRSDADASYTTYERLADGSRRVYSNTQVNIHDSGRLHQTFNELLPEVTAAYDFDDVNIYASFNRGYKSGGYNTQMFSDVLQQKVMETMGLSMPYRIADIVGYRPETSWNGELGVKTRLLGGRLSAEALAFFISCRDQQLTVFPVGMVTGRIMTNAGRTRSMGAEATLRYRPVDDLLLTASYGYTNATFRSYNNGRADYRGRRVPYVPEHTVFAAATWRLPFDIAGLRPSVGADVRCAGDIMWNEDNTLSQPFYAVLGANITLDADRWSVRISGENLTDTRYATFYFMSMGNQFTQSGRPVAYSATVRYTF